ncbi:MAG: apolipoprotein N-acyltransferase [Pyrinomonadaceae bacterium]
MVSPRFLRFLPSWQGLALAALSAILLILAFPDFEYWFLAWAAFVPVLLAIEREKGSVIRSFLAGWVFGTMFFIGTCWWLTYSMIRYGGLPPFIAYFLLLLICLIVGIFPAIFAAVLSVIARRLGGIGFLAAPFVWVSTELLRYLIAGTSWNAIAYSQAFGGFGRGLASIGGIYLTGFAVLTFQSAAVTAYLVRDTLPFFKKWPSENNVETTATHQLAFAILISAFSVAMLVILVLFGSKPSTSAQAESRPVAEVATIQPNVPMSGLNYEIWMDLRKRHVELAEEALKLLRDKSAEDASLPTTVIFPESPMNFMYADDPEFQAFIRDFASKHDVDVLFNSAEPNPVDGKYFNSAVLTDTQGREIAQYDKIHLVPFGEVVPAPFENMIPALVGSFSYGTKYGLMPFGEAKAGIVICYESAFGSLTREFVRRGADVLIEMTNDGYLGPTPVLRQHLANSVFRAVETNRPLLRTTNIGIGGYITPQGEILDATKSYTEDIRVWPITKSDGKQTFYVKYGDWFAWVCVIVTIGLLIVSVVHGRRSQI